MADLHFVLPGSRLRRTGGFVYDDRIIKGLEQLRYQVVVHELPDGFPSPSSADLERTAVELAAIPSASTTVIDGLALGVLPDLIRCHRQRLTLVALVHHPLAKETGLDPRSRDELFQSERDALAFVDRVITTSKTTADGLSAFQVNPDKVAIVHPGADPAPLAARKGNAVLNFFCAATLTKRKGHDVLLRALADLTDRGWHLTCAGSITEDPETAEGLFALRHDLDLEGRVAFLGEVGAAQMRSLYRQADAFVLASHYEGYGMVLSEALTYGLPVVSTTGGAIPEAVDASAAILVRPGDSAAFGSALARFLDYPELRRELAKGAEAARLNIPTWDRSARLFADAVGLPSRP